MHHPKNLDTIYGPPQVTVSVSTLPWSFVEISYASGGRDDRYMTAQADGSGEFSTTVPLATGVNVIEIVSRHGASAQQERRFLQLRYAPAPSTLDLTITEPTDGDIVPHDVLTIVGYTAPDAQVVLNSIILDPDETGRWEATIFLQPGENEIHAMASLENETAQTTIAVTYEPEQ